MIQKICHIILCAMLIASCGNRQKATTASQEVVPQESIDTVAIKNTSVLTGTFWEAIRYKHYDGEKTTEYNLNGEVWSCDIFFKNDSIAICHDVTNYKYCGLKRCYTWQLNGRELKLSDSTDIFLAELIGDTLKMDYFDGELLFVRKDGATPKEAEFSVADMTGNWYMKSSRKTEDNRRDDCSMTNATLCIYTQNTNKKTELFADLYWGDCQGNYFNCQNMTLSSDNRNTWQAHSECSTHDNTLTMTICDKDTILLEITPTEDDNYENYTCIFYRSAKPPKNTEYLNPELLIGSWIPMTETDEENSNLSEIRFGKGIKQAKIWQGEDTREMNVVLSETQLYDECPNDIWSIQLVNPDYELAEYFATLSSRDTLILLVFDVPEGSYEEDTHVVASTFTRKR